MGDDVTFVVNRNINFTNVCYTGCRFCAFAQRRTDADAYSLSLERGRRPGMGGVGRRRDRGVHAGRHRPRPAGDGLLRSVRAVKAPGAVDARARVLPDGDRERGDPERAVDSGVVDAAKEAGLDTHSRHGRRDPRRRGALGADQGQAADVDVDRGRHAPRTRSGCGRVDDDVRPRRHARALGGAPQRAARIQDQTGGFTEFVPLPFVHQNAPLYLAGVARPGPTHRDNRAVHALARIMLHGRIDHIQTSWVKLGVEGSR